MIDYIYNGYIVIGYIAQGGYMSKNNVVDSEQLTDSMYYILLALVKERHGYAIMKFVEEMTDKNVVIGPGTLYTLLKKLHKTNWISQTSDDRTKTYKITEEGFVILRQEYKRRRHMVEDGRRILEEEGYEE
ncbi:MAG: PadR family transcriptional regulator, partial [Longicatena sp.]